MSYRIFSYPPQLLIFQSQDSCALSKQLHFDSRQWLGGGEITLGTPTTHSNIQKVQGTDVMMSLQLVTGSAV